MRAGGTPDGRGIARPRSRRRHCRLAEETPSKADLVKLRFFAGLSLPQAAAVLGISPTTADRHWAYARAWLYNELRREE